jgi:hypothetical protein
MVPQYATKTPLQMHVQGLRFRTNVVTECAASECSLLCDDFHRLGYKRVLLDPSVRVGYG